MPNVKKTRYPAKHDLDIAFHELCYSDVLFSHHRLSRGAPSSYYTRADQDSESSRLLPQLSLGARISLLLFVKASINKSELRAVPSTSRRPGCSRPSFRLRKLPLSLSLGNLRWLLPLQ